MSDVRSCRFSNDVICYCVIRDFLLNVHMHVTVYPTHTFLELELLPSYRQSIGVNGISIDDIMKPCRLENTIMLVAWTAKFIPSHVPKVAFRDCL